MAREFSHEIALRDLPSRRQWTFAELESAAQQRESAETMVFPRGNSAEFVLSILRAWRHNQITCPLETNQFVPSVRLPPAHIVHLKTTSATSGAPKLVAMTATQLAADADNIVATMKLRRDWPNLWGPRPTVGLPLFAAAGSAMIVAKFAIARRTATEP